MAWWIYVAIFAGVAFWYVRTRRARKTRAR
jgi:hypothetical protein